jgi:hypothetical protein
MAHGAPSTWPPISKGTISPRRRRTDKTQVPKLACPTCLTSKARKSNHLLQVKRRRDPKFHGKLSTATSAARLLHNRPADTSTTWYLRALTPAPSTWNFFHTRITSSTRTVALSQSSEHTHEHSGPLKKRNTLTKR